jgi:hypothetical protein
MLLYKFGCAYDQNFFNEKPCIDGEQINFHGFDIVPYCCNTSYCNGPINPTTTPSILTNKAITLKHLPELFLFFLAIYF